MRQIVVTGSLRGGGGAGRPVPTSQAFAPALRRPAHYPLEEVQLRLSGPSWVTSLGRCPRRAPRPRRSHPAVVQVLCASGAPSQAAP